MKYTFTFLISLSLVLIFAGFAITFKDDIMHVYNIFFAPYKNVTLGEKNEYYRDYDFQFVQNTDNFTPLNEQDILNVFYTFLNSGNETFTFYCIEDYPDCINQIQELAKDQEKLSDINNYVHPFNQFDHIETEYDSLGRVTVTIQKAYNKEDIDLINEKVDLLYDQLVNPSLTQYDNIKAVHDYIISNVRYDSARSDYGIDKYRSNIAYGPLFEGWAVCGGYSDLMQLFLERLDIKSYKVSSEKHVWNAVYLNNRWLNLDLTWDDPVSGDGKDYLEHNYFLIDTNTLLKNDTTEHLFDYSRYPELQY